MTSNEITPSGYAALTEWLGSVLKTGDLNTAKWAEKLGSEFDGSAGNNRIEIGGFHTASGHPETYVFGRGEIVETQVEE